MLLTSDTCLDLETRLQFDRETFSTRRIFTVHLDPLVRCFFSSSDAVAYHEDNAMNFRLSEGYFRGLKINSPMIHHFSPFDVLFFFQSI